MHLRTINNAFSARGWPIELVKCDVHHYCYLIYDDKAGKFDTKTILVPRINDLSLERWLEEAQELKSKMELT